MAEALLRMVGIRKRFENQIALDGANLEIRAGEIHALIGENGAGKSTLMRIAIGALTADEGSIELDGVPVQWPNPKAARDAGLVMVHQDLGLNLYPGLTVEENIFFGHEPLRMRFPLRVVDWRRVRAETKELLSKLRFNLAPDTLVAHLGMAERQIVAVANALSTHVRLLILDEPTAVLSRPEAANLLNLLHQMRAAGVTIIYITHRIDEITALADRVTVLRDGGIVVTEDIETVNEDRLLALMAGPEPSKRYPKLPAVHGRELLRVKNLSAGGLLREISLALREGEVVGLAGMAGSGRTALARVLFGLDRPNTGAIWIEGRECRLRGPNDAIKHGIGYLTEDRSGVGLIMGMGAAENITLAKLKEVTRFGLIQRQKEDRLAAECVEKLGIITPGLRAPVRIMSGGNQQKVMIGRTLFYNARLIILDDPSRNLDIAAKVDLYNIMNHLVTAGAGILLISSDLSELLGMCNRIMVMREGRIVGELKGSAITEENVLRLACATEKSG